MKELPVATVSPMREQTDPRDLLAAARALLPEVCAASAEANRKALALGHGSVSGLLSSAWPSMEPAL